MELSRRYPVEPISGRGLLYPMMLIAALAVVVFSVVGIASITGWLPAGMMNDPAPVAAQPAAANIERAVQDAGPEQQRTGPAFQCAECGVIDSIRDIDRRSALFSAPVAVVKPPLASPAAVQGL